MKIEGGLIPGIAIGIIIDAGPGSTTQIGIALLCFTISLKFKRRHQ